MLAAVCVISLTRGLVAFGGHSLLDWTRAGTICRWPHGSVRAPPSAAGGVNASLAQARRQVSGGLASLTRVDRTGAQVHTMILVAGLARLHGLRYLGSYGPTPFRCQPCLKLTGMPERLEKLPAGTLEVTSAEAFLQLHGPARARDPQVTFFINSSSLSRELDVERPAGYLGELLSPEFRRQLKCQAPVWRHHKPRLWSSGAKLRVAVHVRRGDTVKGARLMDSWPWQRWYCRRALPSSYYLEVWRQIRSLEPGAEALIFSSSPWGEEPGYRIEDFSGIPGTRLHLDGPMDESWVHMVWADVLVLSRSTFSTVPGFLSDGLVIYPDHWQQPLPHWIRTDGTADSAASPSFAQELTVGLKTLRERSGPRPAGCSQVGHG